MAADGPDIRTCEQPLAPGSFLLWAPPARGLKGLLSFGRSGSDTGERLKALAGCAHSKPSGPGPASAPRPAPPSHTAPRACPRTRRSPGDQHTPRTAAAALAAAGPPPGAASAPASYSLAGGACLVVHYGLGQAAGLGLPHATPNVHHDPATRTACVFTGASGRRAARGPL